MNWHGVCRSLYVQVVAAIVAGVLLGYFLPRIAKLMKPLAYCFISLISMLIAPIVFCTVVTGIAGMDKMKQVGRTGGLAQLYFEAASTMALIVGLIIVNVIQPGASMNVDPAALDADAVNQFAAPGPIRGATEFLVNLIPVSIFDAFAKNNILHVLLFAVLFGFVLHRHSGREGVVFQFVEAVSQVLCGIVSVVMRLAPIGAFGAMAYTVGKHGSVTLLSLGKLMLCFYATCLVFVLSVLGTVARLCGFRILQLIRYLKEELLIVLGTSSSELVLPRMLVRLENLGVTRSIVDLVIPTGYSYKLDGTSIYLTMAAVFLAQSTNTPLDLAHQLTLLAVLLLTSKGAAGVTGNGFIVLAATLSAVGTVPVAAKALILGIDRFMSEARALTNLVGNAVATPVVGKWNGGLDETRMQQQLGRRVAALPD